MSSAERRAMIAGFSMEEENPEPQRAELSIPHDKESHKDFRQEIEETKDQDERLHR